MKREKRNRYKRIYVRVNFQEYDIIMKRASKFRNLNEYMIHVALEGKIIERIPSITLEHFTELNRIGNNVNQLARRVNSSEANIFHRGTKAELQKTFDELQELLNKNVDLVKHIIRNP